MVRAAVPEVEAIGAIALNRAAGGLNPLVVEIAPRGERGSCGCRLWTGRARPRGESRPGRG